MTTFLNLTNRLLRRINEAEIDASQFDSVRGLQATAKDAIVDTIRKINKRKVNWVFNAVEHTETLVAGQEVYDWPSDFAVADWNSFQIQKDDTLAINTKSLLYINRDLWYKNNNLRDSDFDAGATGRGVPDYVFEAHGEAWGVTPSPNEAYSVKYKYFKTPDDLESATDEPTIPSEFDYVIISGGLYHLNLFKDNAEMTAMTKQEFYENLSDMVRSKISWPLHLQDTRV